MNLLPSRPALVHGTESHRDRPLSTIDQCPVYDGRHILTMPTSGTLWLNRFGPRRGFCCKTGATETLPPDRLRTHTRQAVRDDTLWPKGVCAGERSSRHIMLLWQVPADVGRASMWHVSDPLRREEINTQLAASTNVANASMTCGSVNSPIVPAYCGY